MKICLVNNKKDTLSGVSLVKANGKSENKLLNGTF